ncbi:MAG: histidinol dehydrogenase [Ignisphaera sp.]
MTIYYRFPNVRPLELEKVLDVVKNTIEYVRKYGDKALKEFTKKFDGVDIDTIAIDRQYLLKCCKDLEPGLKKSIDIVHDILFKIHELHLPKDVIVEVEGVRLGYVWRSIDNVGIYVPGGKKSYPSSLLMAGVPAKVAKVKKMYVASPPMPDGCVNPAVAYVALKLDVDEVYRIGGAQAIAALAYGTESVKKVDKIVGPGNIYVQAAKFLVQDAVAIDGVEGPTELVVVADESADPEMVSIDMMAQAEHGQGTFIVLISNSKKLIQEVGKILEQDKDHDYYIVEVSSIDEAIDIVNTIAPEHLSLHVAQPQKYLNYISNVGAISLGKEPPALIDYIGPNHILPTNRWATSKGALSVYDFLKPLSIILDSSSIKREVIQAVLQLAEYEGFKIHSKSIGVRFGSSPS